jgi:type VI secretion system protein ImpA
MTPTAEQPRILNVESLLAVIPGGSPTGTDLRANGAPQSTYYRLKDARAAARATERAMDEGRTPTTSLAAEWRNVLNLTQQALEKESKDLEVACWMVEALVRTHGFAGLREGLTYVTKLVGTYWGTLYSLKDDEGLTTTVAPITSLNGIDRDGALIQPIRKVPLTAQGDPPYAAYHYQLALALEQTTDKATREKRMGAGVPTVETFVAAVRASPVPFLKALLADVAGSIAALGLMGEVLREKCGDAAPATSKIRETLESVQDILRAHTAGLIPPDPVVVAPPPGANGQSDEDQMGNGIDHTGRTEVDMNAAIGSREDALRLLGKVSAWFRAAEPHSPIAFTLDDVIRRARMTLPELLIELLPDANARRAFLTSAGIKPTAELAPPATPEKK